MEIVQSLLKHNHLKLFKHDIYVYVCIYSIYLQVIYEFIFAYNMHYL